MIFCICFSQKTLWFVNWPVLEYIPNALVHCDWSLSIDAPILFHRVIWKIFWKRLETRRFLKPWLAILLLLKSVAEYTVMQLLQHIECTSLASVPAGSWQYRWLGSNTLKFWLSTKVWPQLSVKHTLFHQECTLCRWPHRASNTPRMQRSSKWPMRRSSVRVFVTCVW